MNYFKIIPHTGDIRLKVGADSPGGLFSNALAGMNEIIKEGYCNKVRKLPLKHSLTIHSQDLSSLLVDFLSDVLTYTQIDKALFCKVNLEKLDEKSVKAKVLGSKVDRFDEDIKAVTYHKTKIKKNDKGNFQTVIVFDV